MIRKIIDYYPDILKPYREIMGIADGDQWLFSRLWDAADQAFDDQFVTVAGEYGIMSIPTLMVVKNGEIVNTAVGVRPKNAILSMLGE